MAPNLRSVLAELKKVGTAQNIKIYKRHGAQEPLFGVSYAHQNRLSKLLRQDTELARGLWDSGNMDARVLACRIANPQEIKSSELDQWVKAVDYTALAGEFGALVKSTPFVLTKVKKWMKSRQEFIRDSGYSTMTQWVKHQPNDVPDEFCREVIRTIEKEIHNSPNFAKNAMNMTLIGIGVYKPRVRSLAKKTARQIGKVDVDHGETSCKTPDALSYIEKSVKHLEKKSKA